MEVQRGKLKGARKISLWLLLQLGILAIIILIVAAAVPEATHL
jgi:hypothetical protein